MNSRQKIPILMYHSIDHVSKSSVMRSLHVRPQSFRLQMFILKLLGYQGLSMRNLHPYLTGEKTGKVVGITFDDGYKNNLVNAGPILKKLNFSSTCYIVSGEIGNTNIWDKDKGIDQKKLMTKQEIFSWINDFDQDIGAHSVSHPDFNELNSQELEQEILGSKTSLEDSFNRDIDDFCYPFGKYHQLALETVKSAGFKTATTMKRGLNNEIYKPLELERIPITFHTLPHLFIAKILTNYENKR